MTVSAANSNINLGAVAVVEGTPQRSDSVLLLKGATESGKLGEGQDAKASSLSGRKKIQFDNNDHINKDKRSVSSTSTSTRDSDLQLEGSDSATAKLLKKDRQVSFTKKELYSTYAILCLLGTLQLLPWNSFINTFDSISAVLEDQTNLSDLLGGFMHLGGCISIIGMLYTKAFNPWWFTGPTIGLAVCYAVFPLITQFCDSSNQTTAKILMVIVAVAVGVFSGIGHVVGYYYSLITAEKDIVWVSTGNGVAGVISFIVYLICSYGIFTGDDVKTRRNQIWAYFIFSALFVAACVPPFLKWRKNVHVEEAVVLAKEQTDEEDLETGKTDEIKVRSLLELCKACWETIFACFFILTITLLCFPGLMPLSAVTIRWQLDFFNGSFQVMDLLTRFIPTLGGWTLWPAKNGRLWPLVALRAVFLLFFEIPYRAKGIGDTVLGNTWWSFGLFMLFTVSNGWLMTCAFCLASQNLQTRRESQRMSEILSLVIEVTVCVALFASRLLTMSY